MSDSASKEHGRYLRFLLGGEHYAMPLLSVREVIAMPEVTPIPHTPPHFLGIMNLRGQVISVLDLRMKLGMKIPREKDTETAVIICDLGGVAMGVVVSSIDSVLSIGADGIQKKPQIAGSGDTEYISGVSKQGDHLVLLIDIARALNVQETQIAMKAAKAA